MRIKTKTKKTQKNTKKVPKILAADGNDALIEFYSMIHFILLFTLISVSLVSESIQFSVTLRLLGLFY